MSHLPKQILAFPVFCGLGTLGKLVARHWHKLFLEITIQVINVPQTNSILIYISTLMLQRLIQQWIMVDRTSVFPAACSLLLK